MSGDETGISSAESLGTRSLALVCVALWLLAAASTRTFGIWLAIGVAAVALGVAALVFERPALTALLQPSPRLALLGLCAGGLMSAVTYLLYPVLARLVPLIATDTALLYSAFRAPSSAVASVALVPVIVGEELVWRGVVQGSLARRLGPALGVVLAAVTYALICAPLRSPVLVAVALVCGLVWGALRATTASLVPTLIAHLMWDVLLLLWLPLDSG
jgi:membrane protease YdiL (CAAX protease family)